MNESLNGRLSEGDIIRREVGQLRYQINSRVLPEHESRIEAVHNQTGVEIRDIIGSFIEANRGRLPTLLSLGRPVDVVDFTASGVEEYLDTQNTSIWSVHGDRQVALPDSAWYRRRERVLGAIQRVLAD